MGTVVLRRRLRRLELKDARQEAAATTHAVAEHEEAAPTAAAEAPLDLPALHRSLAAKKKAVQILTAFARELAGCHDDSSERGPPGPLMDSSMTDEPPSESEDVPPPDPPPRYHIYEERGMTMIIDAKTGGLVDSATALAVLSRRPIRA